MFSGAVMQKILILLAEGFEEIEAVTIIDVLRRAELHVTVAGVDAAEITGAHGIKIAADILLDQYRDLPDAVILPGGMPGSENLKRSSKVLEIIKRVHAQKKLVAAICAAPAVALGPAGILDGKKATCFPGFEKQLPPSVQFSEDRVILDGNVLTSRGPGTAFEFSLKIVEQLSGKKISDELKERMLVR
jgi:4-methyl-5(b-hydroxyethyl)-thiazole monophosphate biosynthesis